MSAATVIQIKNYIVRNAVVLGNSDQEDRHYCGDLLNYYIKTEKDMEDVCEGTYLCASTIRRMMNQDESALGKPYNPSSDTCSRILRYFEMEGHYKKTTIKDKYKNKPK